MKCKIKKKEALRNLKFTKESTESEIWISTKSTESKIYGKLVKREKSTNPKFKISLKLIEFS